MKIRYENTAADMITFQVYQLDRSKKTKRTFLLGALIPAAAVLGYALLEGSRRDSWLLPMIGMVGALIVTLVMQRFMRKRMISGIQRSYVMGQGRRSLGEHALETTAEGIVERTGEDEYTYPWADFTQVIEIDEALYLCTAPTAALVIPRDKVLQGRLDRFAEVVKKLAVNAD